MKPWVDVYIGLGSNLHSPLMQVEEAIAELKDHRHLRNISPSPIYRSKPVGPQDQPDFINAVAYLQTQLGPHDLLDVLQSLETQHTRQRKRHWGERTLDLDLLIYGNAQIQTPRLKIPHPLMFERSFVLYPLADLNPDIRFNNGQTLGYYLNKVKYDLEPVKKGN